jgi:hypothetical protein
MANIDLTKDEMRVIYAALHICNGEGLQDFIDKKMPEHKWFNIWQQALSKISNELNKEKQG